MPRSNFVLSLAAAAFLGLFVYALIHLLSLRYQRGDVYPPSSTLRPDPLGTRAFYEALPDAGDYTVERGYVPLRRELARRPATLFLLGFNPSSFTDLTPDEVRELGSYVWNGGHVVITLEPVDENYQDSSDVKSKKPAVTNSKGTPPAPIPEPPGQARTEQEKHERERYKKDQEEARKIDPDRYVPDKFHPSLLARWGFGWDVAEKETDASKKKDAATVEYSANGDVLAVRTAPIPAEEKVPWKSPVFLKRIDPAWQIDYRTKDQPVVIDRKWGRGEIIVATDSYFVSNEALRDDRAPRLLSWIAGPPGRLLFDETHLGTSEQDGVMVLIQRYRLEGYLYGLLIVTALFLWRQSVPLAPPTAPPPHTAAGGVISGKDSRSGLVNLLRHNIKPRDLLALCIAEWRRSAKAAPGVRDAEMESVFPSAQTAAPDRIVSTYRDLCRINTDGRPKTYANKS